VSEPIKWKPVKATERSALRNFPGPWSIVPGSQPMMMSGVPVVMVSPVGRPRLGRWIMKIQIKETP
jgi:hypothetical protein